MLDKDLDDSSRRAIEPVINTCQENAKALLEIFQEVNNGKRGSALDTYRTIVLRLGKANQVDTLMQDILRSLKILGINQLFKTATHAQISKLEGAIDRLSLEAHREDARTVILKTLHTSPYLDRKNRNPDRVPWTCQWFVDQQLFQQWRESTSSSMLWVSADPGCGKSVLAKHLVDCASDHHI